MNDKYKSMAMLDIAIQVLKENKGPMTIHDLIHKVAEFKDFDPDNIDRITQFYMDLTQSAMFVYCGDDQWNLKDGNLELWDQDGFAYANEHPIEDEDEDIEEDLDFTEFNLEDVEAERAKNAKKADDEDDEEDAKEEEEDEEIKEEKKYIDVELPIKSTDDDDDDDEPEIEFDREYDEDDYNEIMDDYEDMYDE